QILTCLFIYSHSQSLGKIKAQSSSWDGTSQKVSLVIQDFPDDHLQTKKIVSGINAIAGVTNFNITAHPPGKAAVGEFYLQNANMADRQNTVRDVFCKLGGSAIKFNNSQVKDCQSIILNK